MGVCVCVCVCVYVYVYVYTVLKASVRVRKGVGSGRLVAADGTALIAVEPWPPRELLCVCTMYCVAAIARPFLGNAREQGQTVRRIQGHWPMASCSRVGEAPLSLQQRAADLLRLHSRANPDALNVRPSATVTACARWRGRRHGLPCLVGTH
jgi:hypothetical protein